MSDEIIKNNGEKHSILDEVAIDESQVNDLIEKYDAESRYRRLSAYRQIYYRVALRHVTFPSLHCSKYNAVTYRGYPPYVRYSCGYILFPAGEKDRKHRLDYD